MRWGADSSAILRAVLGALAVALQGLVATTRADPKATDYRPHVFARLQPIHLRYAVVAAVTAYVPGADLWPL